MTISRGLAAYLEARSKFGDTLTARRRSPDQGRRTTSHVRGLPSVAECIGKTGRESRESPSGPCSPIGVRLLDFHGRAGSRRGWNPSRISPSALPEPAKGFEIEAEEPDEALVGGRVIVVFAVLPPTLRDLIENARQEDEAAEGGEMMLRGGVGVNQYAADRGVHGFYGVVHPDPGDKRVVSRWALMVLDGFWLNHRTFCRR